MKDHDASFSKKRVVRYSCEKLELPCEWGNCDIVQLDVKEYIEHIEEDHLKELSADDLACQWKECEAFTETISDLKRHVLFHAFHTKIKCYGKNLQQRENLTECLLDVSSRNIIPELPDPLACCWIDCVQVFENPEVFYRHVESHVDYTGKKKGMDGTIKCLWQGCNKMCADYYKVKDHMKCHTQEKLVACPTCGGMFASRTKFFDHIQRQAPNAEASEKTYVCKLCSRKLATERLLRDHTRHHVNHYKCPYCDMTCPTPSGLQAHVRYRHSTSKPFSCQYCEYKAKRLFDLRKHLETHSTIPNFRCPFEGCNFASKTSVSYRAHLSKRHTMEKAAEYACHLCQKTFSRGHYLSRHLVKRHKFRWPSGHCRFRYHQEGDGMYRLQTVRYESAELSEAMLCNANEDDEMLCNDNQQEAMFFGHEEDIDSPDATSQCVPDPPSTAAKVLKLNESQTLNNKPLTSEASGSQPLSNIPILYCIQNEQPTTHLHFAAENGGFCQTPDLNQQVILQLVDSNNKPYVTADGSSVVLLNIPDTGNQASDQTIRILG